MTPESVNSSGGSLRILAPALTNALSAEAEAFLAGLESKVPRGHSEIIVRDTELGVPQRDDVVVLLVPTEPGRGWRRPVRDYLAKAIGAEADVLPVALRRGEQPPPPIDGVTAFSVAETMQSYHLSPGQFREAGTIFARIALARLWPTYSRERIQLFLSYRRADGEPIVRALASAISDLNHTPSRDLADIRPGTQVAAGVARELDESDVFVLCDTPEAAGEHAWLKDELCVALGLGLPIVWARFGQVGKRSELPISPADKPDLDLGWPADHEAFLSIAAQILDLAFVAGRNQVRRIESYLSRVPDGMKVEVLDARRRIMLLQRPRRLGQFEMTDRLVVQAYARRPTADDGKHLFDWLVSHQWASDDGRLRAFDLAVMIAPSPAANGAVLGPPTARPGGVHSTHGGALVNALSMPASEPRPPGEPPELLLFAGIGRGQGAGQEFRDAVQDVAAHWLGRGGRIRFGGHPTVTPTVNWIAQVEVPGRERDHVTIYQSKYFVTPQLLAEISEIATVVPTEVQGEGADMRQRSLTHMRERMVGDSNAVAAIVIGGLTRASSGRPPGVEEEMNLARRHRIPVFVLGATGGQAAVLVHDALSQDPPFAGLGNALSTDDNEFLATTDDYGRAAELIWEATTTA